ncbi:MAG: hypothetical protein NC310_00895 [Roseburia sp.]|nr:hypothetical protein [Anaeroplasma bactoclasticum]MCM1195610.1 hypothetical protein [Roseburia sp.]MCM1556200.1 hypothetical protein [Anaeroplasma bactoclasticum]
MYKIHNDIFSLCISEKGAELEEVCVKGINILWQGNQPWEEKSPILFPIIGNLKDGFYKYKEQSYFMNTHGFLKKQHFDLVEQKEDSITLKSTYSAETLIDYPFKYEFYITYTLIENRIQILLKVKNLQQEKMYFSLGLHPGFDYDGLSRLFAEDFSLFLSPRFVHQVEFNPVFVDKIKKTSLPLSFHLKELSSLLKDKKTLCYQGVKQITLASKTNALSIKHTMPFVAFWQCNPDDPRFLCIEPWMGLPDKDVTNHQISEKFHIQQLDGREAFHTNIEIEYLEGAYNGINSL